MKEIQLTKGKVALVDDEVFDYLNQWKWYAKKSNGNYYAKRNIRINKKYAGHILMHRLLMNVEKHLYIDHIDGFSLNNQKNNLRICTHAENMRNKKLHINNTSGFKGVYWHKSTKKWMAFIKINNKQLYLGLFIDPIDAARTYNEAAVKYHGEFANLNKID